MADMESAIYFLNMLKILRAEIRKKADKERAKNLQWFFKTGKGEYAEGDLFLGLTSPQLKDIAKKFKDLDFKDLSELIKSKHHEERMLALVILKNRFAKADEKLRKQIFDFYIKNRKYINNWDLVDVNVPGVIGAYLENKDKLILYKFTKSKSIWDKRIAMLSCFYYICKGDCKDALKIAEILKNDEHDLIHKAVGWMLREVGKRCGKKFEEEFLKKYYKTMPRTMLRYAIERFPEKERQKWLGK
jgi:3-methyladenine DNA glycosylase AlkD